MRGRSGSMHELPEVLVFREKNPPILQSQSSDLWVRDSRVEFDNGDNIVARFPECANRPKVKGLIGKELHLRGLSQVGLQKNRLFVSQNPGRIEQRGLKVLLAKAGIRF